jgi:hypothetical protein
MAFCFLQQLSDFPRNPRKSIYGDKYTKDHYLSFVFFATCSPSFVISATIPNTDCVLPQILPIIPPIRPNCSLTCLACHHLIWHLNCPLYSPCPIHCWRVGPEYCGCPPLTLYLPDQLMPPPFWQLKLLLLFSFHSLILQNRFFWIRWILFC